MSFSIIFNNKNYNFNISTSNWESNNAPSMIQSTSTEIIKDETIEKKLDLLTLPNEIKNFYKEIGTTMQEIYICEWTFFSIENIIKMCDNHKKNNINTIDIAFKYKGMGHVKVAFYDPRYKSIFYRNDGGSNGYEREHNYINLKNFNNSTNSTNLTNLNENIKYELNFERFLQEINGIIGENIQIF